MKRLFRWLQPSLARRVLSALLLAFALVAVALLAQSYLQFRQGMADNPGVRQLGELVAASVAEIEDEATVAKALGGLAVHTNKLRREAGLLPGDVLLQIFDIRGREVYATARGEPIANIGAGEQLLNGKRHWTWRGDGPRWSIRVAEPAMPDQDVLGWLALELGGSMLLAFPLVLLPLWLAVYSGLSPLRHMARRLASVDATPKLAALDVDLRYAELQPLGRSFDALLERLRRRLARERAFVHDAAHELRTPLAVIAAQTHLLTRAQGEQERRDAAESLLASIRRTAHLSQQLLDLAALDREPTTAPQEVDLAALTAQMLASQIGQAQERGIELSLETPEHLPRKVDLPAFQSVLQNLLDNALRYVPRGGRVEVSLQALGDAGLRLKVADDGPGIAPAEREQAFERFWRGKGHGQPGSGLGLAIVKQAARRLGGTVLLGDGLAGRGAGFELSVLGWS